MTCKAGKFPSFFFLAPSFFICFFTSPAFSDASFYTLADHWEKANSSGVSKKDAVEQSFSSALTRTAFPTAGSAPVPIALKRTLNELTGDQRIIEIEQNQSLFVKSNLPVVKFISTEERVSFETLAPDTLRVEGTVVGSTFIHIWTSDEQRHTFQIQVIPQKFVPSLAQVNQQEALEKSRSFKIGYGNNESAFYTGERYREISRTSLAFDQNMSLEGDTPYGAFSSHVQTQKAAGKTLLSDAQAVLKDGRIGPLKNFDTALGDSRVTPSLMAFPGARIRGADLIHQDPGKKANWETFYGREQSSIIGTITSGIQSKRSLNSFLRGGVMDLHVNDNAKIKGGYFAGSGTSRAEGLPKHGGGLREDINLGPHISFTPETDYDNSHFAGREAVGIKFDKLRLRGELRDINKHFQTLVGPPGAQGELGYLLEGNATLAENVILTGSTDIFRDRLIPNPEALTANNVHTDLSLGLTPWEGSNLLLGYQSMDDTGRLGPNRQTSYSAQFNQRVNVLGHRGNIFTRDQYRDNVILNNPLSDYHVNQVTIGYAMPIFWGINFSISEQINFLDEYNIPDTSTPRVLEYNFDYSNQIKNTPFFMDLRFRIRDEAETESVNSFMSGYDTTELSGSLYYRGYENMEIYLTGSFENYKQESLLITTPRVELQFLTGVRYLYDTKIRWSAVGSFEGVVFKDLNGDGQRQPDEPGVEGMAVRTSDNREAVTDRQGYYVLKSVSGRKVSLMLDTSRLPYGYVQTTSAKQELPIEQGVTRHVDFGVTPRSGVTGIVFNDVNGNGKYDVDIDKGVGRVRITLENGASARTNNLGVYSLSEVLAGPHTASIDFSKLPEGYLPEGIPQVKFTLFEGIRYELNFPLQAARSITGRVYTDTNKNKVFDPDEKPLGDVRVLFGDQAALTDKDGWYLFDSLPNGSYELSLDEKTLPAGCAKPAPTKINLPLEPVTITNADLPVQPNSLN